MVFVELNDGRKENLYHISNIDIAGCDVIYYPAKGSSQPYKEHFSTEQEAQNRYEELKKKLVK